MENGKRDSDGNCTGTRDSMTGWDHAHKLVKLMSRIISWMPLFVVPYLVLKVNDVVALAPLLTAYLPFYVAYLGAIVTGTSLKRKQEQTSEPN